MDDTFQPDKLKFEVNHSACFVAGTLVHTDKGLVPIEQLKVGDMVLSKPESGEGELAYKRVLRTFISAEKQKIMRMAYPKWRTGSLSEPLSSQNLTGKYGFEYLYCTENHAFWTKERGWLSLKEISQFGDDDRCTLVNCHGIELTTLAGRYVIDLPLYQTIIPEIAVQCADFEDILHYDSLIDFRSGHPVILVNIPIINESFGHFEDNQPNEPYLDYKTSPDDPVFGEFKNYTDFHSGSTAALYRRGIDVKNLSLISNPEELRCRDEEVYYYATVYNIEVEHFHTYFVGESAIWVHNTSCTWSTTVR